MDVSGTGLRYRRKRDGMDRRHHQTFKGTETDAGGCVTGKPVRKVVSMVEQKQLVEVFYGIREGTLDEKILKQTGLSKGIAGKTMVIQGMGNVGSYTGLISQAEGDVKIIGLSGLKAPIYSEKL